VLQCELVTSVTSKVNFFLFFSTVSCDPNTRKVTEISRLNTLNIFGSLLLLTPLNRNFECSTKRNESKWFCNGCVNLIPADVLAGIFIGVHLVLDVVVENKGVSPQVR